MNKNDLELFKQALLEALDKNLQEEEKYFAEEIQTSEKHKIEMNEILSGKYLPTSTWKLTKAKIAAILIAATLVLVGCAVAYRNEIRDFIETVYEDYISVGFENSDEAPRQIKDIYQLTYIPQGYEQKEHIKTKLKSVYVFENSEGNTIRFEQQILNGAISFDSEYSEYGFFHISGIKVYYYISENYYCYLWNDGKYALTMGTTEELSYEELGSIIDGTKTTE